MAVTAEIAAEVISSFTQAAAACRHQASRQGNIVCLAPPFADEALISADLHGNRVNFERLLEVADLDHHPKRHLIMQEVCHGGPMYPSGNGCMSHLMLEDMARLKLQYPERFHFLLSNHELSELTEFPICKGRRMLNLVFLCGLQEMYGEAANQVRQAAMEFIAALPVAVRLASGVFISHSLPEKISERPFDATVFERPLTKEDCQEHGALFRLVWGRDFRRENAEEFARLVNANVLVHGHEPCVHGFSAPNDRQIILDCCGVPACYLLAPVGGTVTHAELLQRITQLL